MQSLACVRNGSHVAARQMDLRGKRMKVRLYGFTLKPGHRSVSLDDLYDRMAALSGKADTSQSNMRYIYFNKSHNKKYALGIVITVRNQKSFCKLGPNGVVTVENLKGNQKMMEFNFFLINKKNGVGLYQQYHHSCGMFVFGGYLISHYKALSQKRRDDEINALEHGEATRKKVARINRAYKPKLSFAALVHKASLKKVLSEFAEIKFFQYEFSDIESIKRVAAPLSPFARRRTEKVTFKKATAVSELASAIQDAVKSLNPRRGRVQVTTQEGDPLSIALEDIPENYGEEEYDTVVTRINKLKLGEFYNHPMFNELIETVESKEYKGTFSATFK